MWGTIDINKYYNQNYYNMGTVSYIAGTALSYNPYAQQVLYQNQKPKKRSLVYRILIEKKYLVDPNFF